MAGREPHAILQTLPELAPATRPPARRSTLEADPDARSIAALLDGIPGAYERAIQAREQADAGQVTDLDDL